MAEDSSRGVGLLKKREIALPVIFYAIALISNCVITLLSGGICEVLRSDN